MLFLRTRIWIFFFFPWSNGMHFLYPIRYWFLSNVPITILKNFSSLLFFLLLSLQSSLGHDRSHSRVKQIGIHTPTQPPRDLGQATYYSEPQFSYLHNGDTMSLRLGGSLLFQSSLLLFISITSPPTPTPSYRSFTCLHSWLCLFFFFFGFSLKFPVNRFWCMFSGSQMITALWCPNAFQMGKARLVASVLGP